MFLIFRNNILKPIVCKTIQSAMCSTQKTTINNQTINYIKVGNGPKNILCWPGAFGTIWSDFKPQIEGLDKDKFTLVAWDPPGYGGSRPPNREFSLDFYHKDAQFAHKLMVENLGLEKFSILGWSDGGISGIILASEHQENIDKLVVWGSNSYIVLEEYKAYEIIADITKWSAKMRNPLIEIYTKEGLQKMCTEWYNTLSEMYQKGGNICKECVEKVKVPTLIVHGDKDPMVASEHPEYLFKNIKHSKLHRFPDGKHNIHLKYAQEFNQIITDFIQ